MCGNCMPYWMMWKFKYLFINLPYNDLHSLPVLFIYESYAFMEKKDP